MHAPGVYIGFAGPNNIGKTTQATRLADYLMKVYGIRVKLIKFPMYDLLPYGPLINRYFRDPAFRQAERDRLGLEGAEKHIAKMVVENHGHYEPMLQEELRAGTTFIVEDCVMNSIAWSQVAGYTLPQAMAMHQGLAFGDITIFLNEVDGQRYERAIERGHVNEEDHQRQVDVLKYLLELTWNRVFQCERVDFELGWSEETVFSYVLQAIKTRIVNLGG